MKYKVYRLSHPEGGDVRYVGRTDGDLIDRLAEHIGEVSNRTTSGTKSVATKKEWIRGLITKGRAPMIELLGAYATKEESILQEYYWQAEHKMRGFNLFGNTLRIANEDLRCLVEEIKTDPEISGRSLSIKYGIDRKSVRLLKKIYG